MNNKNLLIIAVVIALIVAASLGGIFWISKTIQNQRTSGTGYVIEPEIQGNEVVTNYTDSKNIVAEAEKSIPEITQSKTLCTRANGSSGCIEAAKIVEKKLASGSLSDEARGVALFESALYYANAGDYPSAISIYKKIASDLKYSDIVRATAIQDMAYLFTSYRDLSIRHEIFKDEPYKTVRSGAELYSSFRNLYTYAASIYPLEFSEMWSANWYAQMLYSTTTMTTAGREQFAKEVQNRINAGQPDLNELKTEYSSATGVKPVEYLNSLLAKAIVIGYMELSGYKNFGEAEPIYKELISEYTANPDLQKYDWSARTQYSLFLAHKYGSSRSSDIASILEPILKNPESRPGFSIAIRNADKRTPQFPLIASLNPDFKAFMLKNGWKSSDMTATKTVSWWED